MSTMQNIFQRLFRRPTRPQHVSGSINFTTHFYDELFCEDGTYSLDEGSNLITDGMRTVLAALFANQAGYAGVQYWAIGSGPANGDPLNPPAALPTDAALTTEIARVPVTVSFVDDFGNATGGSMLSKHVQVQATFGQGIGTGSNVEFGLLGGNASASVGGTGYLLNHVTHPVKFKNNGDVRRLTIVIDF
jgi:hypothetical protein